MEKYIPIPFDHFIAYTDGGNVRSGIMTCYYSDKFTVLSTDENGYQRVNSVSNTFLFKKVFYGDVSPMQALENRDWAMREVKAMLEVNAIRGNQDTCIKLTKSALKIKTMQMVEHDRAYDGRTLLDDTPTRKRGGDYASIR